jgi:Tol biopolymer transport system component
VKSINYLNTSLKISALFLILFCLTVSCKKDSGNESLPETFNYEKLTGKMAFSRSSGKIVILNGTTKTDTAIYTKNNDPIWDDGSVAFSPDGKKIAYSALTNEGYQIHTISVNGTGAIKLSLSLSGYEEHYIGPVWNSTGDKIYYVANSLLQNGPVFRITTDGKTIDQITEFNVFKRISVSQDNSFIVYASSRVSPGAQQGICTFDIQYHGIQQLKMYDNNFTAYSPALSPDQKKIAYVLRHCYDEEGTAPFFFRIITMDIDGSNEFQVIELLVMRYVADTFVTWSPDGTKLAYNYGAELGGKPGAQIYIINADGTGLSQVTDNTTDYDGCPSWVN